jgi:hypothetical protein
MKKLILILAGLSFWFGCGNSTPIKKSISVNLSPSAQMNIDQGQIYGFTASVSNDSSSQGVSWSMSGTACTGTACGTFTSKTTSGATYNAPAMVASSLTVTITATSVADSTKTMSSKVVVNPNPAITTTTLANGTVGTAYSSTLAATGGAGTLTWSVASGSTLPAGLSLSSGNISGTPTAAGTFSFTVQVTDSAPKAVSATQQLSLTINPVGLNITTTSLSGGVVNSTYSATLQSSGGTGTVTWAVSVGSLPTGLTLNGGVISGKPSASGTTNFTVQATDSGTPPQVKTQALSIAVNPALSIGTTSVPGGTVGITYSQTVAASGGTLPVTWSVTTGSLPTGLSLQGTATASGTISGTPTASGTFNFTATAKDSSNPVATVNQALSISIANPPLSVLTTSLPGGVVGTVYSEPLQASGGTAPYTWTVASGSSLPTWMSISGSGTNWTIGGNPTAAATSTFTLQVSDSSSPVQTKTQALSVTINPHSTACGTGHESILHGQYAFSLSGFNSSGFLAAIGSFTADGSGHITAGTVDGNGVSLGVQNGSVTASGSSYSVGSDNRGCATIVTPFYTFTTRFALNATSGTTSEGSVEEWESGSTPYIASGEILKQTVPTAMPDGTWVYQQNGVYSSSQYRVGIVGTLTSSGLNYTAGEYDSNSVGTLHTYTGLTGTHTAPNATTGRFTATTTLSGISAHRAEYLINSTQFLELVTDTLTTGAHSILVGKGQLQSGALTITGNLVFYASGLMDSGSGAAVQLGRVTVTGATSLTADIYQDNAGTWSTPDPSIATCTYSIDTYGRLATSGSSCGTHTPVFYLTGHNAGFMQGTNAGVLQGQIAEQSATSLTAGDYHFGTQAAVNLSAATEVGVAAVTSGGGVTGTSDLTSTGSPQQASQSLSDTLTVSSDGTFSTSGHPGVVSGIVISNSQLVLVDSEGSTNPTILIIKSVPIG